jgi:hypothetical protein
VLKKSHVLQINKKRLNFEHSFTSNFKISFMKKLLSTASVLLIILIFIAGCGPSSVVVRTQPVPPVYARPAAPGGNYVWVEGEWIRRGHGYVYREWYWTPVRARHHRYVTGHWQRKREGWYWVPGHWN